MKDKLKEPMSSEDGDKLLYDIKNQELIVNSLKIQNKSSKLNSSVASGGGGRVGSKWSRK